MSEDLKARLLDWQEHDEGKINDARHQAADCIEALEAKLKKTVAALELYSCDDNCNECPESERDRVSCGWIARAALAELRGENT